MSAFLSIDHQPRARARAAYYGTTYTAKTINALRNFTESSTILVRRLSKAFFNDNTRDGGDEQRPRKQIFFASKFSSPKSCLIFGLRFSSVIFGFLSFIHYMVNLFLAKAIYASNIVVAKTAVIRPK